MTKSEIISNLEIQYNAFIVWLEKQDDNLFEVPYEDKWSPAQHADHIIKSTEPLNQALRLPKMALRTMFGKNNRDERNYDEVVAKYESKIQAGGAASGRFVPKEIKNDQKAEIISTLRSEFFKLTAIIEKWDDKRLSSHLLPHPLLGKMTINEMLYFTIFHTEYHLKLLKRDYGDV